MTKAHSSIGASSMYRWSVCPGSVKLSEGMPNKTSVYAADGTLAHEVGERCLRGHLDPHMLIGGTKVVEGHEIEITEEMVDAVKVYIDEVSSGPKTAARYIEHRFDLSAIHPGLFGTCDYARYDHAAKLLTITDYKHGAGIAVEVAHNPQLQYYALGALLTLGHPVNEVEMVVVQPRCYHPEGTVRRTRILAVDLLDFQVDLIQYAKATEDPNAIVKSGDHCRFCLAAPVCPALRAKADAAAANAFTAVSSHSPDELAKALALADVVEGWAKSVREFAYAEAEAGRPPLGWKLVDKVARRAWKDEGAATNALKLVGLGETKLYAEPVLRSPAQIEKVLTEMKMKPEQRKAIVEPLVEKKSSGNVLVIDSDKRPAASRQTAAEAFTDA